jgi:hypothetical protein
MGPTLVRPSRWRACKGVAQCVAGNAGWAPGTVARMRSLGAAETQRRASWGGVASAHSGAGGGWAAARRCWLEQAVGVLRAASEDCWWPTFRRCVDKARQAVHRDNRAKRGDDVPLAPSESAALDLTPINGAARRDGGCGRAQSPNCLIY